MQRLFFISFTNFMFMQYAISCHRLESSSNLETNIWGCELSRVRVPLVRCDEESFHSQKRIIQKKKNLLVFRVLLDLNLLEAMFI